jgi:hypothetical protein
MLEELKIIEKFKNGNIIVFEIKQYLIFIFFYKRGFGVLGPSINFLSNPFAALCRAVTNSSRTT